METCRLHGKKTQDAEYPKRTVGVVGRLFIPFATIGAQGGVSGAPAGGHRGTSSGGPRGGIRVAGELLLVIYLICRPVLPELNADIPLTIVSSCRP